MGDILAGHPNIKVKRLNWPITEEAGSEQARAIGSRPEHKAAFVIWGDYVLDPEPEMYVHFDILRQTDTYLGGGAYEQYGPMQIQQPSMFDFKLQLGSYLGELTTFASGLALFDAGAIRRPSLCSIQRLKSSASLSLSNGSARSVSIVAPTYSPWTEPAMPGRTSLHWYLIETRPCRSLIRSRWQPYVTWGW